MSWSQKTKILQQLADSEINTPDGQQILVGALQDEILIYAQGFNNYKQETKNP